MNTFEHLVRALDTIGFESSTKLKQGLLAQYLKDGHFKQLVVYLLDPYRTYGIKDFDIPKGISLSPVQRSFADLMDLLEMLNRRQLTGGEARRAVAAAVYGGVPADLMLRILNKDPKAGFGATLVNKACPGLIPEFPYMRCSLPPAVKLTEWDWEGGVYSQLKSDGMFTNINFDISGVQFMSRQGTLFPMPEFAPLIEEIQSFIAPGTQTHGELLVEREGKILARELGNGILNSVAQGGKFGLGERAVFHAWDQIPLEAVKSKGTHNENYGTRYQNLQQQLALSDQLHLTLIESRIVHSLEDAYAHYKEKLVAGLEGTIIKEPWGFWRDGTSKDQVKLKLDAPCDLVITGFRPGKGKNAATFGAIEAQTCDGLLEVGVSGFTDAQRKTIHLAREAMIGRIMTVKSNLLLLPSPSNKLHSLFLPRFVEIRTDKHEADSLQRVKDQFEAAIKAV